MAFLLYHKSTSPTGRYLAAALDIQGRSVLLHGWSGPLIRWGSAARPELDKRVKVLNNAQSIMNASNKHRSLEIMQKEGINVPKFSKDPDDLRYPILGRRYNHTRGADIVLCLQRRDWLDAPSDFYTQYIPTVREYRVHVAGGVAIKTSIKSCKDIGKYEKKPWIRNHTNGFFMVNPSKFPTEVQTDQAIRAVRSLGLDFGAVDMVIGEDDQAYVLEVNTGPGLIDSTSREYVKYFEKELGLSPKWEVLERVIDSLPAWNLQAQNARDAAAYQNYQQQMVAQQQQYSYSLRYH